MVKHQTLNKKEYRGFIGPLGDDIPSIFPIVFGVLIFLGTMTYALNQYNQKNSYLNVKQSVLDISNAVDNSGYLSDSSFSISCQSLYSVIAKREGIHAIITVEKFCPLTASCYPPGQSGNGPVDLTKDIFNVGTNSSNGAYNPQLGLYCDTGGGPVNQYALNSNGVRTVSLPVNYEIINFPVAVDCCPTPGALEGVGMANVVGWGN